MGKGSLTVSDRELRRVALDRSADPRRRVQALRAMEDPGTAMLKRLSRCPSEPVELRLVAALLLPAAEARLKAEAVAKPQVVAAKPDLHPADANRQFSGKNDLKKLLEQVEAEDAKGPKPPAESLHDAAIKNRPAPDWKPTNLPAVRDANAPLPEPTREEKLAQVEAAYRISNEAVQQKPDYTTPPERKRPMLSASFSRDRTPTPIASAKPIDEEAKRRMEFARLEMTGRLNYMTTAEQMKLLGWKDENED